MENYQENFTTKTVTEQKSQQLMPILSLGGVSPASISSTLTLDCNKTSKLKKSSKNDSSVSLSPISSSPLPSQQKVSSGSEPSKFKALIKRNQTALMDESDSKSPDLLSIANRVINKMRTNSPLLSSTGSTKPLSPSPSQNLISSTIYELKEKTDFQTEGKRASSDFKVVNSTLMTNSSSALSADSNKTTTKPGSQTIAVVSNRLFPDLNGFKLNTDLVTSTSLLNISNKNNAVNQAKRRILSVIDTKSKEEKDSRLKELDFLNTIGTGTFGRVMCVRHKATKKYFALKIMSIINIIKLKQIEHVKNEKNILESINNHPFIVNLFWTHHTDQFLCKFKF